MRLWLFIPICFALVISGCSTNSGNQGRFYQHDGPPDTENIDQAGARPRVEPFKTGTLRPYTVLGQTYYPIAEDIPFSEEGVGSWYGKQFHGKKTATGELYDMFSMTAAHPTLPLPSYAVVTNLENGRSILVRVNDRGPFLNKRVIDLSYAAAKKLGYANKGTAKVKIRRLTFSEIQNRSWDKSAPTPVASTPVLQQNPIPVSSEPSIAPEKPQSYKEPTEQTSVTELLPEEGNWAVQIGFFSEEENAKAFMAHAEATLSSFGQSQPTKVLKANKGYRVLVGDYLNKNLARSAAQNIGTALGIAAFPIQK